MQEVVGSIPGTLKVLVIAHMIVALALRLTWWCREILTSGIGDIPSRQRDITEAWLFYLFWFFRLLRLQWKQETDEPVKLIKKAIELDNKCEYAYEILGTIEVQRYGNEVVFINVSVEPFPTCSHILVHLHQMNIEKHCDKKRNCS